MNEPIQMLWVGKSINIRCTACISSFLEYGHEVHLYLYEPVSTVLPDDLIIKDAREIMPESEIFYCQTEPGKGSPSPFSDYFRWKLLRDRGGWWVDADVACVQHWDFAEEVVLAGELSYVLKNGEYEVGEHYATCVMKLPKGHDLAERCYNYCTSLKKEEVTWTQPAIDILNEYGEPEGWKPPSTFCPVFWNDWKMLYDSMPNFCAETHGVHLWNEMIRRHGEPVHAQEGSFVKRLLDDSFRRCRRRKKLNAD